MRATPNPRKRLDSSGRMASDAEIRRQKLRAIQSTGNTEGINPRSLERFYAKGYIVHDGARVILTKKGAAVATGKIGAAGWDIASAPKRYREEPAPVKNPRKKHKNPSPGEMIGGEHASAETRKMIAKALAWYGDESLVNEPKLLKSYNAPDAVVEIGQFIAIEYESNKFDGKPRIYRHDITRHRKLYISPDGSTIIIWPPLKVTKRGIEG